MITWLRVKAFSGNSIVINVWKAISCNTFTMPKIVDREAAIKKLRTNDDERVVNTVVFTIVASPYENCCSSFDGYCLGMTVV